MHQQPRLQFFLQSLPQRERGAEAVAQRLALRPQLRTGGLRKRGELHLHPHQQSAKLLVQRCRQCRALRVGLALHVLEQRREFGLRGRGCRTRAFRGALSHG